MEKNQEVFTYTYSARQQEEIKRICNKYISPEEDKIQQLKALDRSAEQKAQAWAIAFGVLGTLLLGTGMSFIMSELSSFLGGLTLLVAVPVGILGMVLIALAYPLYSYILKKERKRIAPEIMRLADELLK